MHRLFFIVPPILGLLALTGCGTRTVIHEERIIYSQPTPVPACDAAVQAPVEGRAERVVVPQRPAQGGTPVPAGDAALKGGTR